MAAITWQNVNGPSLLDPGRAMESASRSFNGAFDGLASVLKQREATGEANYKQVGINNTNAMFGAIQEAATPEEYAAREAQLRQQLLGYGANVDSVAVRNSMDSRLATLQGRAKAGIEYKDTMEAAAVAPDIEAYKIASLKGDTAGMAAAETRINGRRGGAAALDYGHTVGQRAVTEGRATAAEDYLVKSRPLTLAGLEADNASKLAATAEKAGASNLNKLLLQHNQGYSADIANWNTNVKAIGQEMKLPVNASTGMPDLTALNPETLKAFKARIGTPPSSSERLTVFKQQMTAAGVPLEQQVKAEDLFDKTFGTGASISEVDKKNLETKTKQLDERLAARKKSSMLYPGSEEEKQAETVATQSFYDGRMKDSWFVGDHRKAIDDIMQNGLKIPTADGGGTTVPIPPKLMKLALSSKMQGDAGMGSLWMNSTKGDVKDFLTKYVQTPEYAKEMQTLAEIEADPTGAAAKKKLLDSYSRPTMSTGPVQYVNSLTDAIDSANARAQSEAQKKTR